MLDQPDLCSHVLHPSFPVSQRENCRVHPCNFVEACCGPSSLLSQQFARTHNCTRITAHDDFGSKSSVNCAKLRLTAPGDVLWVSTLCTGGCPWQRINKLRSKSATLRKFEQHSQLHYRLWSATKEVIVHALSRGCTVFVEWPDSCDYWRAPDVAACMSEHHFSSSCISACMVGLRSVSTKTRGELLSKRWRVMCNSSAIASTLHLVCNSTHKHVRLQGSDTQLSENYTPLFAEHVHKTVLLHGHSSIT